MVKFKEETVQKLERVLKRLSLLAGVCGLKPWFFCGFVFLHKHHLNYKKKKKKILKN
jgi:hypothetical protein